MEIGLSLAHDLARSYGGTVQAFSDGPGHGSRFEIVLPIVLPVHWASRCRADFDPKHAFSVKIRRER